jgi:hypothetical protein
MENKDFFILWNKVCEIKDNKDKLLNLYNNQRYKEYTNFILNNDDPESNSIISQISKKIGLKYYSKGNGYYFIDAVFYKGDEDMVPNEPKNKTWKKNNDLRLRKIRIAFEHEMEPETIWQEICHLLTINSDCKVIVTYNFYKRNENKISEKWLEDFQEIMKHPDVSSCPILAIIGDVKENDIIWCGYEISKEDYLKIEWV